MNISQTILEDLIKLAKQTASSDEEDFNVYDICGGNYDDAYYAGTSDGEILLARNILRQMGVNY